MWDATQYLRFGGERTRPFIDLIPQQEDLGIGVVLSAGTGARGHY